MATVAERHQQIMARTPVTGRSPRGYVTVDRTEQGEVSVRLRPDALQRLTDRELETEINAALEAALADYRHKSGETLQRLARRGH